MMMMMMMTTTTTMRRLEGDNECDQKAASEMSL